MCNLIAIRANAAQVAAHFNVSGADADEISVETIPKSLGLVVRAVDERRVMQSMCWGFPRMTTEMRVRDLAATPVNLVANLTSPMWERMVQDVRYRCLIPLTHFAEPDGHPGSKTRTWFTMRDAPIFAWAGFCRNTRDWGPVFAGMTTDSNEAVMELNPRMPVLLKPSDYERWLRGDMHDVIGFQFRKQPADDLVMARSSELWVRRELKPEPQFALTL